MDAGRPFGKRLTPQRVAALEAVPGWAWEVDTEAAWQEKLAALRAYVDVHGRQPPKATLPAWATGSKPSGTPRRLWTRGGSLMPR